MFTSFGPIIPLQRIHSEDTITDSQKASYKDIHQSVIYKIKKLQITYNLWHTHDGILFNY